MIIGTFFLLVVFMPLLLLVYFIDKSSTKPKGNIILGATLPSSKMEEKELLEIVDEYRKKERIFIIIALITSIPIVFVTEKSIFGSLMYLLFWCIFIAIGEHKCMKKAFNKIQTLKEAKGWFIEGRPDEDKYWSGLFYNNPNDKRFMVEKRVGIGTTINAAHPGGKIFLAITGVFFAAVFIPVGYMTYKFSNADFHLNVDNNKIIIEAPVYGIDFNKEDIEDVEILDKMPRARRTNGVNDGKISLGNYKVDGYGKSKVYIKNNVNNVVFIKLKDSYIFISGDSEEETKGYYNELVAE